MFIVTKIVVSDQKSTVCGVVDNDEGFMKGYEILLNSINEYDESFSVKHVDKNRIEVFKKGVIYGSTLMYVFEIHTHGAI
jgi:hypothetical protein